MAFFRRSREPDEDSGRWAVVGLGNPGPRYARTRHNVGAVVLDELASRTGVNLKTHKSGTLVGEARLGGESVLLARPTSYMNESGRPVGALLRYYKVPFSRLVVVHDELDIHFGEVRVKVGGGTAGHNGLSSLVSHLGTKDFVRVRVGVSRPPHGADSADYVLTEFSPAERKELPFVISRAADAVETVLTDGVDRAMNLMNTREA